MKYLNMWWNLRDEKDKLRFRKIVDSGQLEIVNGGWSMPDEACSNYEDLLNNYILGH